MSRRKVKDKIKGLNKLGNGVFGLGVLGSVVGRKVEGDLKEGRRNIEALMKQQVLLNSLNAVLMFDDVGQLNEFLLENHEQMVEVLTNPDLTRDEKYNFHYQIAEKSTKGYFENYRKIPPEQAKLAVTQLEIAERSNTIEEYNQSVMSSLMVDAYKSGRDFNIEFEGRKIHVGHDTLKKIVDSQDFKNKSGNFDISLLQHSIKQMAREPLLNQKEMDNLQNILYWITAEQTRFMTSAIDQSNKLTNVEKNIKKAGIYENAATSNWSVINEVFVNANNAKESYKTIFTEDEIGRVNQRSVAAITRGDANKLIQSSLEPFFTRIQQNPEDSKLIIQGLINSIETVQYSNSKEGVEIFDYIKGQFNNFAHYYFQNKEFYGKEDGSFNFYEAIETKSSTNEQRVFERENTLSKHLIALPYIQGLVKHLNKEEFVDYFDKMGIEVEIAKLVYDQAKNIPEKTLSWLHKQANDQQNWFALNGSAYDKEYTREYDSITKKNSENVSVLAEKAKAENHRIELVEVTNKVDNRKIHESNISTVNNNNSLSKLEEFYNADVKKKEELVHESVKKENEIIENQKLEQQLYDQTEKVENKESPNTDVYIAKQLG